MSACFTYLLGRGIDDVSSDQKHLSIYIMTHRGERDCIEGGNQRSAAGHKTSGFSCTGPLQGRKRNISCSSFWFSFIKTISHFLKIISLTISMSVRLRWFAGWLSCSRSTLGSNPDISQKYKNGQHKQHKHFLLYLQKTCWIVHFLKHTSWLQVYVLYSTYLTSMTLFPYYAYFQASAL